MRVGAYGAFTVGPGDVYRLPRKLDILEEKAYPLEAWVNHNSEMGPLSRQHR